MTTNADHQPAPRNDSHDQVWTEQRIRALGAVIDIPTAGQILRLSSAKAYQLVRANQFPFPLIPVGPNRFRVPVTGILAALGFTTNTGDLTAAGQQSVDHHQEIRTLPTTELTDNDRGEP